MFWKVIRWGGTIAIVLLVLAAVYVGTPPPTDGVTVVPADPANAASPPKNFNL